MNPFSSPSTLSRVSTRARMSCFFFIEIHCTKAEYHPKLGTKHVCLQKTYKCGSFKEEFFYTSLCCHNTANTGMLLFKVAPLSHSTSPCYSRPSAPSFSFSAVFSLSFTTCSLWSSFTQQSVFPFISMEHPETKVKPNSGFMPRYHFLKWQALVIGRFAIIQIIALTWCKVKQPTMQRQKGLISVACWAFWECWKEMTCLLSWPATMFILSGSLWWAAQLICSSTSELLSQKGRINGLITCVLFHHNPLENDLHKGKRRDH